MGRGEERDRGRIEALGLGASFASVAAVSVAGAVTTTRSMGWYRRLDRPGYGPPDAAFAPVWSVLYAAQAVAAWLVWRDDARRAEFDVPALSAYGTQLALNAAWTLLFFGLRRPGLALLDIVVLWVAIAVTVREFGRRHRFAAALLLPYLAWVTYAAVLNADIWWRNR